MTDTASPPKISLALGGARKSKLPINGLKRPHSALHNDNDDDEDESHHRSEARQVSHFDAKAGGAIDENRPKAKGPLVIASQKNRDWKEASKRKRQRGQIPEQTQDQAKQIAAIEEAEKREKDRTLGLNVMKQDAAEAKPVEPEDAVHLKAAPDTTVNERSADDRAMDALLGNAEKSTLVVPAVSETDAFRDDFRSAPDMATLDDYARVPVEEFGAAMLRGMGWKDGEGVGLNKPAKATKTETLLRRPALLGIGAKADAAIDAELGGWGKAARGKEIKIYNPVLLKDKKTGELVTEEDLQKRREEAQRMAFEEEFEQRERRRKNRDRDDDNVRERPREEERERSQDRRRHRDHDHDRPRDDRQRRRDHGDDRDRSHRHRHARDRHHDDGERRRHRDDDDRRRRDEGDRRRRHDSDRDRSRERRHERR